MENNGFDGGQNGNNGNNKNNNFSSSSDHHIWDQFKYTSSSTLLMCPNGGGHVSHSRPLDPHLTCLKLGKRQYFEDGFITPIRETHVADGTGGFSSYGKKSYYNTSVGRGVVLRCQVEGCHVSLVTSKEYHRRHKVCEMHSKAVVVVVSGLEQRFCQQCSRFHDVSEFDESKRSCRRRLAGHNQRRRKSSHDSVSRNSCQDNKPMIGRIPIPSSSSTQVNGHARSLLSSKFETWDSSSDISARSRAALRELIEENRATILARQLLLDVNSQELEQEINVSHSRSYHNNWEANHNANVTLNLMQAPSAAFGFLSGRGAPSMEEEEEDCSLWS